MNCIDENEILQFKITILSERYYSHDTSWGVYQFSTDDEIPHSQTDAIPLTPFDTNGKQVQIGTLAGKMQELTAGGEYMVKATVVFNEKFGYQYNPIAVYALVPQTTEQQIIFLKSLIPERIAENLTNAYPNIVNDVIDGKINTIDYSKVKGVREATWLKIKDKIINNYLISDIIALLKPLDVTFNMIKKLIEDEPNPVLLKQQLYENPYVLVKIKGLGFKKIDNLALSLKPSSVNSKERLVAFIKYYFTEIGESEGHTWVLRDILENEVTNNVPECKEHIKWLLNNQEFIYAHDNKVGLKYYRDIEIKIFDILKQRALLTTEINISDDCIEDAIQDAENVQCFKYTEEQVSVIKNVLKSTVSLITGKAGTGKTSIMKAIIRAYEKNNYTLTASALSAMAAQRITEATDYPAATIHRTLGCKGANIFTYNKGNHICTDVMLLDEGSMVNASLFLNWLEAIDEDTRIIISGDHKQLPPIGYGNIFSDLIDNLDKQYVNELKKPMRQAQKSGILVDANIIRNNKNPITEGLQSKIVHGELQDMYYMFRENREALFSIAVKTYLKSVETDGIDNVVIAVPRKQGCKNSTYELNQYIQNTLLGNEQRVIEFGNSTFKLGAKVMQVVNNYDKNIFNGEIGFITNIGTMPNGEGKIVDCCEVTFDSLLGDKKTIHYEKKELDQLDLAYAMTTHKLQGCGKKTVIGIIDNTHYKLLDNCMLYTMLTRAKKRCLLLAEPQAFLQCIRTSHNRRNTWLQVREGE